MNRRQLFESQSKDEVLRSLGKVLASESIEKRQLSVSEKPELGEVVLTEGAAEYGFVTPDTMDEALQLHQLELLDTSAWYKEQYSVFKVDRHAAGECIDCIGSFQEELWGIDSYTGWAKKSYVYENGYVRNEVQITPYEKAQRDYQTYLIEYNNSRKAEAAGEAQHTLGNRIRTFDDMFPPETYGEYVGTPVAGGGQVNASFVYDTEFSVTEYDYQLST
jgi:hypothetical protein